MTFIPDDTAVCAQIDGDLWFPPKGGSSAFARAMCRSCPLINPCLEDAIANKSSGIWGGTSENERRALRKAAA